MAQTTTKPKATKKPVVEAVDKAADKVVDKTEVVLDKLDTVTEVVADNLDDLLVGNNKFVPWMKRGPKAVIFVGAIGLVIGAGITYYLSKKRLAAKLEKKYAEKAEDEVAAAKQHYGQLYKNDLANFSPSAVVERIHGKEAADALQEYKGEEAPTPEEVLEHVSRTKKKVGTGKEAVVVEETRRVTTGNENTSAREFDYEREVPLRTSEEPYVISQDEYYQNEQEYTQTAIVYYEADDTAVDEQQQPIDPYDDTLGDAFISLFGYGSTDPNICYVRNERSECDFEIVRHEGKYTTDVLGFSDEVNEEIRHAASIYPRPDHARGKKRNKSRRSDD
jgi:hypothetical protein